MSAVLPPKRTSLLQRLKALLPARWRAASAEQAEDLPVRMHMRRYGQSKAPTLTVAQLGIDQGLLWCVVLLLLWGLVMVYSASIAMPDNPRFAKYAATHFLSRHVVSLAIGTVLAFLAFQIPVQSWEKYAPWLFGLSLVLLIAVLIPGIGKGVNGARRWISLGIINFQPSELAKFATIL